MTAGPAGYETVYVDGYRVYYERNGVQNRVTVAVKVGAESLIIKCEGTRNFDNLTGLSRPTLGTNRAQTIQILDAEVGVE